MWKILELVREDQERLRESQRRRGLRESLVDDAAEYDRRWREKLKRVDELRRRHNEISKEIGSAGGEERETMIERAKTLSDELEEQEEELAQLKEERDEALLSIPNVLDEDVPRGEDEEDNVPIRFHGRPKVQEDDVERFVEENGDDVGYDVLEEDYLGHADLLEASTMGDVIRAGKVAGSRFFYLFQDLVWLDHALMLHGMDTLTRKGFLLVQPPYMMNQDSYSGVTSFEDFRMQIYKIEDEDLYLIATSEHPLAAMFKDEVLEEDELPITLGGVSPCFRKEAGAHGRDTKGVFRVHQFNKVEQFVFCKPEDSLEWHERLIENAEEVWKELDLPYRVVNVCTGDLGAVAYKKYDLEAWMPSQGRYREMVSCSNCLDYQSVRLDIRYAETRGAPSEGFVHTLNATAVASTRAITAILENNQVGDGRVEIPPVLQNYLEDFPKAPKEYIRPVKEIPSSR